LQWVEKSVISEAIIKDYVPLVEKFNHVPAIGFPPAIGDAR